jgi:hypothetical protein
MKGATMRNALATISIVVALASGCASAARAPEEPAYQGPNQGAEVAKACGGAAIGSLKGGPIMLPVGAAILVACLPLAAGVAVMHEVLPAQGYAGADTANFTYPDGSPALREGAYVNGGRNSFGGLPGDYRHCSSGRCW